MSQMIILLLKKCRRLTVKTQNKIKITFKTYFSSLSIVSINDIKEFFYSSSANDDETMIN